MSYSVSPTALPNFESEILPPPPPVILSPLSNDTDPPLPPRDPTVNNPNTIEPEVDEPDGVPLENELDLPPFDSDEELIPLSDSDDDEPPPPSDDEDDPNITLENLKSNLQFVQMVEKATLESQFSPTELDAFRNPQELQFSPADDKYLRLSISFFISGLDHHSSEKHYASSRENIQATWPDSEMLSYDQVKR